MFRIPDYVISLVTFPGVIMHHLVVRLFARLAELPVLKICYFQLANPPGYILHEKPEKFWQSFLITIGPIIVNTLLCSVLGFIALYLKNYEALSVMFYWLAISVGMHAFPYNYEMQTFINAVNEPDIHSLTYIFVKPLTYIFKIFNLLRSFWIDLIYAACMIQLLPALFGIAL